MTEHADVIAENLIESEAALYLRVKPQTLAKWRTRGEGPQYSKIGGRVVYTKQALRDYVQTHTRASKRLAETPDALTVPA